MKYDYILKEWHFVIYSYAINLKIFIDENITHNTDSTLITWIVQQYVLVMLIIYCVFTQKLN